MNSTLFVLSSLPSSPKSPASARFRCSTSNSNTALNFPSISRRALLHLVSLAPFIPLPSLADRTGKYSTKLTAKRRYLPRIARGISTLGTLNPNSSTAVSEYAKDVLPDLRAAMQLFATTYFSEGNRIGALERELGEIVESFVTVVEAMEKQNLEGGNVKGKWTQAKVEANKYVTIAKLQETVPLLDVE